ncbi:MAG TPA: glycosyltransferase [Candidatus Omnitrophota bacterium]|nr:glycosyltransferase [Candidatus Omnitrophota bacterium]
MKILITYASAGAGHRKAAEALFQGIQKNTSYEAVCVDALDHSSPLYKKLYGGTYAFLITHIPSLWGIIFALLDIPWLQPIVRFFRRWYNQFNAPKLHDYLVKEQFDYIFSTHFFPTEVASTLKARKKIHARIACIITDYDVHRIWLADGVDVYAVASNYTQQKLKQLGVVERKIVTTGIPVDEKFTQAYDVAALKEKMGLTKDAFTVLIATGSFGIGPIEQIINEIKGFQVLVVCGHNKKLYQKLSEGMPANVHVLGLVDNMHELMAVSDCMVTKPGGLSITEALVSQLPLIFFNAIPGQEIGNVKVLKYYGIGISGCSIKEIAKHMETLRSSKDAYRTVVNKTKELARPQAVRDIKSLIS